MNWYRKSFHDRNRRAIYMSVTTHHHQDTTHSATCITQRNESYIGLHIHSCDWSRWKGKHPSVYDANKISELLSCSRPPKFISLDILLPLPKMTNGNQLVVIITDSYSKLTCAKQTKNMNTSHLPSLFYDDWIVPCGILTNLMTGTGAQVTSGIFGTICNFLELKHLKPTAHRTHTNGMAKQHKEH